MRRIRKIIGNDRLIPIIKESSNNSTIIKKGYNSNKTGKVNVRSENIPSMSYNKVDVNIQRNSPKPISTVEPIWAGETVYIIGGGPSLIDFDWSKLSGKKTIAVNKSILSYPNADVMYWTDSRVYGWYKNEIDKFKGLKYSIRHNVTYTSDVKVLRKGNKFGLEDSKDAICHGNNSGYAAINLAYLLGAKRIILLGYDMRNDGKRGHYHDGYPVPITGNDIYKDQFIPGFNIIADLLKQKNVEVYNASMISALTAWPKISFDKALSFN
jgi:hypothetical protein